MLQFLTSWPLLIAVAMLLMALVLLIEPAAPGSCEGPCGRWPGSAIEDCCRAIAAAGSEDLLR